MANEISPLDDDRQALTLRQPAQALSDDIDAERVRELQNAAYAPNTHAAYKRAWHRFLAWKKLPKPVQLPVPIELIEQHLAYLVAPKSKDPNDENAGLGLSLSSVNVAVAAIRIFHRFAGFPIDLSAAALTRRGILRTKGIAPRHQAPPLRVGQIAQMIDACGPDKIGIRDRAILALGFSAGLRRSEISGLNVDDVTIDDEKMRVAIRRSKTDQEGQGSNLVIERTPNSAFCAVAAVEAWLKASEIDGGPLFRGVNRWGHVGYLAISGEKIRTIVRDRALEAGLKEKDFSAHSLRAGLATSAFDLDIALVDVSKRLRHKNPKTTMVYDRRTEEKDAEKFRVLFEERADIVPSKPLTAGKASDPVDDTELKELIRLADEAQKRVQEKLRQYGGTK